MYGKLIATLAFAAFAPSVALAGDHGHSSHAAGVSANVPAAAKVPTDAALREGMQGLSDLMMNSLVKRPGPADYPRIADAVESGIDRITKTCQLPPEADERLHVLLVRMLDGVKRLRAEDKQQAGIALILGALDEYGRTFDHPGWRRFGH